VAPIRASPVSAFLTVPLTLRRCWASEYCEKDRSIARRRKRKRGEEEWRMHQVIAEWSGYRRVREIKALALKPS
jgi:hypothetical protein